MLLKEKLSTSFLWFDGGMGTMLQEQGLKPGELPESWSLSHPEVIQGIHESYLRAGADIIKTNTFGANKIKHSNFRELIKAGIEIAKKAVDNCTDMQKDHYIAFDMGPLGKLLKPFGDLEFEDAVSVFAESISCAAEYGVDLILIETMSDSYETKAAVLAAKEQCSLPLFVTNAYDEHGRLLSGTEPEAMVALLEGMRVDALGVNCSLGPIQMTETVKRITAVSSLPVIVNPNAGLPHCNYDGSASFDVNAVDFANAMKQIASLGATVLGGCCGTTPEYILLSQKAVSDMPFAYPSDKKITVVSSHERAVNIGGRPILIGERINPTGKKRFKEALRNGDIDYIIKEGLSEAEKGADILDVNVGLPEINERAMMVRVVSELQSLTPLPLQIDTSDPDAMEAAMRLYDGKPLVNSVNGKKESMNTVFSLINKYGGVAVALTLDEKGIPNKAEDRLKIAENIIYEAAKWGIDKKDIIVDPLAMAVSADADGANETLRAIKLIKEKLGVKVSLGVSNISFGLPAREVLNSAFFTMALAGGLDCAIMNPFSASMMQSYYAYCALSGKDKNFINYINASDGFVSSADIPSAANTRKNPSLQTGVSPLYSAIVSGLRDTASTEADKMLSVCSANEIIEKEIIPALDRVGRDFEEKVIYLPQLLLSAEAASSAFDAVARHMQGSGVESCGEKIILATVKGDIHDIGKNIVKVLLQNYGFEVIDLGRDVPPEVICDAVVRENVRLVGLSALMTTTVPAMAETVKLINKISPKTKIMVGGAVLTAEYAALIGADRYSADAMNSVRYAEEVLKNKK